MKLLCVLFVAAAALHCAAADDEGSRVRVLAAGDLEAGLAQAEAQGAANAAFFVKFFAPWCGHCKRLVPTWAKLADEMADTSVTIASFDCTTDSSYCSKHGVRGYPTLRFFRPGGLNFTFDGPRSLEELKTYATRGASDPVVSASSLAEVMSASHQGVAFVRVSGKGLDAAVSAEFDRVAVQLLQAASFFSLAEDAGARAASLAPGIYALKDGDTIAFQGSTSGLLKWCQEERWLPFFEFKQATVGAYAKAEGAKPAVIVFTSKHHDKASEAARKELRQLSTAQEFRHYQFAWADGNELQRLVVNGLGLSLSDLPQVVLIHLHSYDYYTMSDEASVAQFLHRVDEGKVPKDNMRSIWRSLTGTWRSLSETVKGLHQNNPLLLYGGSVLFVTVMCLLFCISTSLPEDDVMPKRPAKKQD